MTLVLSLAHPPTIYRQTFAKLDKTHRWFTYTFGDLTAANHITNTIMHNSMSCAMLDLLNVYGCAFIYAFMFHFETTLGKATVSVAGGVPYTKLRLRNSAKFPQHIRSYLAYMTLWHGT